MLKKRLQELNELDPSDDVLGEILDTKIALNLEGEYLFDEINVTDIVLVPKVDDSCSMTQFRPISLCNVLYKIISKMLANRLQSVLHSCIDEAQSAFLKGRLISNNVITAYEVLHSLKNKRVGRKGYFAMKLDMSKAYDHVEWSFLEAMMHNEGLSSLIRSAALRGSLSGVGIVRCVPMIIHLFFVDDSIIFGEAYAVGAVNLRSTLATYFECTGQLVNFEKSSVFISTNTCPDMYLGLPSMVGRNRRRSISFLLDKCHKSVANWSTRMLSLGGKEVYIITLNLFYKQYHYILCHVFCSLIQFVRRWRLCLLDFGGNKRRIKGDFIGARDSPSVYLRRMGHGFSGFGKI
ncbi:hypothetical protein GQ457_16G028790 [Hibiscus cannabinus]